MFFNCVTGSSVGKRCPSPLQESYQNAVNPKSHEHGTELKCTSLENKSVKRIVSTSPFFSDYSLNEVATVDQNIVSCKNKEDGTVVLNDHPASLGEPKRISFLETSIKKRKTAHPFDVNVIFSAIFLSIIILFSFTFIELMYCKLYT